MTTPSPLHPAAGLRGRPYFDALRALDAAHGAAMAADVGACKAARGGGITTAELVTICLRYRLTLAAGFAILEDRNAIATGTYDVLRRSVRPDGRPWLVRDLVAAVPWPDAAPGVEMAL